MDLVEAIEKRISCRAYEPRPIDAALLSQLEEKLQEINEQTGFRFQLFGPREDGTALDVQTSMFAGKPPYYAAFVAPEGTDAQEKVGYFGEQFVLFAIQQGLSNCWVAGTYDASTTRADIGEGEKLHDVIPLGYAPEKLPMKQRVLRSGLRRRDKKLEDFWKGSVAFEDLPEWVHAALLAVQKGPSAVNGQPVFFKQEGAEAPIQACVEQSKHGLEFTDMGIAKLHFEIAARACGVEGAWEWGNAGSFTLA